MVREGILRAALIAAITGAVGALVSLLIERAWRRHKAKQQGQREEP